MSSPWLPQHSIEAPAQASTGKKTMGNSDWALTLLFGLHTFCSEHGI